LVAYISSRIFARNRSILPWRRNRFQERRFTYREQILLAQTC
jgi:hypothetical protein